MPTNPKLRKFIVDHFDHGDLDLLIADYFVAYRAMEMPGLGLENRAQNLIDYCGRNEQVSNLEAALQEKYSHLYSAKFGLLAVAPVVRQARDPQKCFLSYAYDDVEFTEKLAGDLRTAGAPVWVAPHSIQPGEKWMRAIERGLKECGVFVCVLTPNALASEWVRDETDIAIDYAKKGEMRILLLLVQACDPAELSVWLTPFQHIPFERHYESGLAALKSALGLASISAGPSRSELAGPPTPPNQLQTDSPAKRSNTYVGDATSAALTIDDMPMCYVPPGVFMMGGDGTFDGKPEHVQIVAQGFWIGKHPITIAQFKMFVDVGGYKKQDYWTEAISAKRWKDGRFRGLNDKWREEPNKYREPFGRANHPAVGVSWYEALAFTRWLRGHLRIDSFGLPSEAEWEYAARGPRFAYDALTPLVRPVKSLRDVPVTVLNHLINEIEFGGVLIENRRIYPWGDDADLQKMHFDKTGIDATSAVGAFPGGMSPFGCEDMSGNVWEWTMTKWTDDYKDYDRTVDNRADGSEARRVMRGGAFGSIEDYARCACRNSNRPDLDDASVGFRVVASPIHL